MSAQEGPEAWLERTLRALAVMDAAELDRLRDEVESAAGTMPIPVAIDSARRAARLQRSLDGLLRSTEEGLRALRSVRERHGDRWEH